MNYTKATNEEVQKYFDSHPDHQIFSNGKQFIEKSLMTEIKTSQLDHIESTSAPGYPEAEDLYASSCLSDNGSVFVAVKNMEKFLLMQVDSIDEARMTMCELWQ